MISDQIQKIENELFKILSRNTQGIYDLTLKYSELRPALAVEKKANDSLNIQRKLKADVETFIKDKEKLQLEMLKTVRAKIKPLMHSVYTEKHGGFIEYGNAIQFVNSIPSHQLSILQSAYNDKRPDFVFSVCELVKDNKNIEPQTRDEIQKLSYKLKEDLGVLQTENDSFELTNVINKAKELLNINYDVSKPVWNSLNSIQLENISSVNSDLYFSLKSQKYQINNL